jgi:predicted dithiol-disulfide oxidoreductase (DUF899 family)
MTSPIRLPNETSDYRAARDRLLAAESDLRAAIERVAAQRRELPLGGKIPTDYEFEELVGGAPRKVKLSELFPEGKDTLFVYSYMYGPEMEQPCPMCTSYLDGIEGQAHHIMQRTGLAVIAKSPIKRIVDFTRTRGWTRLRVLSSHGTTYQRDYFGEEENGKQTSIANVFVRRPDGIHHFWASELAWATTNGQPRHIDLMWPLWNVLDTTPEGRGESFYPKLSY